MAAQQSFRAPRGVQQQMGVSAQCQRLYARRLTGLPFAYSADKPGGLSELEYTTDGGYSTRGGEYSGYASEVGTHRRRGWISAGSEFSHEESRWRESVSLHTLILLWCAWFSCDCERGRSESDDILYMTYEIASKIGVTLMKSCEWLASGGQKAQRTVDDILCMSCMRL